MYIGVKLIMKKPKRGGSTLRRLQEPIEKKCSATLGTNPVDGKINRIIPGEKSDAVRVEHSGE